jgi:peptide chain release factor 1
MNRKNLLFSITKKDFKIDYFSGTGAGGQYRNRHKNCVRLTHIDSNVTVTGQSNRERLSNLKEAFRNLMNDPKFKLWYNIKVKEMLDGISLEQKIKKMMVKSNLKVEGINDNGQWEKL